MCSGKMHSLDRDPPPLPPPCVALHTRPCMRCVQGLPSTLQLLAVAGSAAVRSLLTVGSGTSTAGSLLDSSTANGGSWHSNQTQPPACGSGQNRRVICSSEPSCWSVGSDASTSARPTINPPCGLLQQVHVSASTARAESCGVFDPSQPNVRHVSTAAGMSARGLALGKGQGQAISAGAAGFGIAALPCNVRWQGYAVSAKGHQPSAALREIGNQQLRSFVESPGMLAEPYTCEKLINLHQFALHVLGVAWPIG